MFDIEISAPKCGCLDSNNLTLAGNRLVTNDFLKSLCFRWIIVVSGPVDPTGSTRQRAADELTL
jgi:hypothetical protein